MQLAIGSRLRGRFANNSCTPLPKVNIYLPEEAKRAGFSGGGLGWFDYRLSQIGIICYDDRPASEAWALSTGVAVHEHLHWLWSLSPKTLGCTNESERFVMNVFKDGANEQRAMLEDVWARRLLRRTRAILLPQAWAGEIKEPLYKAGHLVLTVHTLLAVKGVRILRELHTAKNPARHAKNLWLLCEKHFGQTLPPQDMDIWLKAFSISLQAITADSDFTRADLAREFIGLFPPVTAGAEPPDSPLEMGGHLGEDFERGDGEPAGKSKSGKPISSTAETDDGKSTTSGDSSEEDNSDDSEKSDSDSSGETDENENSEDSAKGEPSDLSFDDDGEDSTATGTVEDEENKRELDEIEREIREFNSPSEIIPGAPFTRANESDRTYPAEPRECLNAAAPQAVLLAERLRIVGRPKSRLRHNRGRVVGRIVAYDPQASKPFRSRIGLEKSFGPKVFVGMTLDTSGSMRHIGKITAMRRAAMTVHLACMQENVEHLIATSRTLEHIAGRGVAAEKANALIAGVYPTTGGDNYVGTLPTVVETIRKRSEQVKILLVLTDGAPHNKTEVQALVEGARRSGIIVVGVGLELTPTEAGGMKSIFGNLPDQTVLGKTDGFAELAAEVLASAVTRGSRCYSAA